MHPCGMAGGEHVRMKAKIAYLTTPGPDRFVLNVQPVGSDEIQQFEITKAHLANIIIDGTSLALREAFVHHRVQPTLTENADARLSIIFAVYAGAKSNAPMVRMCNGAHP